MTYLQEIGDEVEEHSAQAIFGSFDGMTSALGIITGLLAAPTHVLLAAVLGLSVASAVGMASGQYLGEEHPELHVAVIMGVATLVGTLLPAIPILAFGHGVCGIIGCVLVACAITAVIAWRRKRWVQTFVVLALVSTATILMSLVTGAGG